MGDNSKYEFDIYTEIDRDRGAVGITHGYIPGDRNIDNSFGSSIKKERESKFPLDRILQATNVDVKHAKATIESDRKLILNTITGRSVDDAVVDDHDKYDELNNIMRGIFVAPALERIIKEKDEDTITRCLDIVKASNSRIITLSLSWCSKFDDFILIKLADSLPPSLTELELTSRRSKVTVNGINACLGKILGFLQLVKLDLGFNCISDDGAKQIADALKVNHIMNLKTLILTHNDIGDEGAQAIADALKVNNSMEILKLFNNKIGDDGAEAIADALKVNHRLETLYLNDNNIGDDGAKAIADALKVNPSLKILNLDRNKIGDDGAKAIVDALNVNHSLKSLYLFSNNISADGEEYLSKTLQELKSFYRNRKISILYTNNR
jgi:ribosomal protein S13